MQILTDSLEVVHAVCNVVDVNVFIRNVIKDILDIVCSFDYVIVSTATCQDVRNVHNLAQNRLCFR